VGAPAFAEASARQAWRLIALSGQVLDNQIEVVIE
jgi:hypothetical protein